MHELLVYRAKKDESETNDQDRYIAVLRLLLEGYPWGVNDEDKSESSVDEFENRCASDDEADDDRDEDFEYASDSRETLQELLDVNAAWICVNKSLPN
ncbi:unnamed protein product [Phytophthora fragariaefolia]|uniref:Unnamed protein product n=1 Tax=Phytophthora fragariaefolia TaxID=1490495 RepID=A0A9W6U4V9_9STRA|nr:unnamed protein product [Phytophthora fragariaefolia]